MEYSNFTKLTIVDIEGRSTCAPPYKIAILQRDHLIAIPNVQYSSPTWKFLALGFPDSRVSFIDASNHPRSFPEIFVTKKSKDKLSPWL